MNIKINNSIIGKNFPCYIVAEISANHAGSLKRIIQLIREAKKSGANAVKIQTYTADSITLNSYNKDFRISKNSPWKKYKNLWSLYDDAKTPLKWHKKIFEEARKINIDLFASVFDESLVDFLETLKCPAYKIASAEISHIPLLKKVAKTKKPIILSSGLADFDDLKLAIKTIRKIGNNKIIVLQCVSAYPASIEESNLLTINDISKKFNVIGGLSDHSLGSIVPITACSLGANLIEKHFDLSNKKKSLDSFFSMDNISFKNMVKNIRDMEKAIGKIVYSIPKESKDNFKNRSSIYVIEPIKKGEVFSKKNLKVVRPGFGLHPLYWKKIIGKKSTKNLDFSDRLKFNDVLGLKKIL